MKSNDFLQRRNCPTGKPTGLLRTKRPRGEGGVLDNAGGKTFYPSRPSGKNPRKGAIFAKIGKKWPQKKRPIAERKRMYRPRAIRRRAVKGSVPGRRRHLCVRRASGKFTVLRLPLEQSRHPPRSISRCTRPSSSASRLPRIGSVASKVAAFRDPRRRTGGGQL